MHKAGFVGIIGLPNAGKSTLLNALLGEKLVIATHKIQTTRHRVLGIYNDDDTQIVFSDTPGFIKEPHYALHKAMNHSVDESFSDADVIIYLTEPNVLPDTALKEKIARHKGSLIILINKADLSNEEQIKTYATELEVEYPSAAIMAISALHGFNTDQVIPMIAKFLPDHPPYFPKDELSDRNVRFFVAEIIREQILLLYFKEIPYASEVVVEEFKEEIEIARIKATIYVERETQKMIILGKGGLAIKNMGSRSRHDIEKFIGKRVHLDLTVKVLKNWRNDPSILKKLGYQQ